MNPEDAPVLHLMSTPVVALDPTTEVGELRRLSEALGIHHFPLVDAEGLCGVVCTCDIECAPPDQAVSRFARRPVATVHPRARAHEAAAQVISLGVGSVIVADEEGIWGILTREDLAEAVPRLMQDVHCIHCSSRQHLRPGPGHTLICLNCSASAQRSSS